MEQSFEGNDLMRRISSSVVQNVSLGKTTNQISTASSRYASRAVDNDVENSSRSQTRRETYAWREIDLGALYDIRSVKLRNRT